MMKRKELPSQSVDWEDWLKALRDESSAAASSEQPPSQAIADLAEHIQQTEATDRRRQLVADLRQLRATLREHRAVLPSLVVYLPPKRTLNSLLCGPLEERELADLYLDFAALLSMKRRLPDDGGLIP